MTLRKGQRFTLGGHEFTVAYVNASRAHCIATVPKTVVIHGPKGLRTFTGRRTLTVDISPQSGVALLMALERES